MKEGLLKYYNQQSKSGARPFWGNPGRLKVGVGVVLFGPKIPSKPTNRASFRLKMTARICGFIKGVNQY
jgi:hypothetical protein